MDSVSTLTARWFPGSETELHIGRLPVGAIAQRHGTPLFVYDSGILERKWSDLRQALPPEFGICYSVKANPHPEILSHFLAKGCGLEIASIGEFEQAVGAGCPIEKILFAGPGKTEAELEWVLRRGIGEIHAESPLEIERISTISRRIGGRARVAVRVNPGEDAQGGAMRMGGKPSPFGVDEESLAPLLDRIASDSAIEFRGIHLFAGTQILDHAVLLNQYRKGIEIARLAASRFGRPLHTVDFGGGLGVPYFSHESELDLDGLRLGLEHLWKEVRNDSLFVGTQFLIEPGRSLLAESGGFVTCRNACKAC